jgi:DNA-binding PadR family transcriptional regulator
MDDQDLRHILEELIEQGYLETYVREDGETIYRLTPRGTARAEEYVHSTPEGAEFWASIQNLDRDA